jgi:2-oxoglutarate ferredoxin oxidoreductase subunit delta
MKKRTRQITIDPAACKGCHLCIDQCPQRVFDVSPSRSPKGYVLPRASRLSDCTACLLCELICPDLAITVEVVDHEA